MMVAEPPLVAQVPRRLLGRRRYRRYITSAHGAAGRRPRVRGLTPARALHDHGHPHISAGPPTDPAGEVSPWQSCSYICNLRCMGTYLRLTATLRAVLTAFLRSEGETWGLRLATETGFPTGTIYPLLARLEREGFVQSHWAEDTARRGPRRRMYSLTPTGRHWATQRLEA